MFMSNNLDIIDKTILFELDKNCRMSDNQLAKIVKRSREAVRNRVKNLQKRGIIQGFITAINPTKYGYMFFKIYFQLQNNEPERKKLYHYLMNHPQLYWFSGNDGVWDLHCTFFAKDVDEFSKIKNNLYLQFKHIILKRDIGVLIQTWQYNKIYFMQGKKKLEPFSFAGKIEDIILDDLDKKLLTLLLNNARIPLVELAQKTQSTVDIIRRRMKNMEQSGIILKYRIAVDHRKLGFIMFKAFVYFHTISEKEEKKLLQYSLEHPNIVYLIKQFSSWDYEIEIMAKSYEEFIAIMNEVKEMFSESIRNYEFCLLRDDVWVFSKNDII